MMSKRRAWWRALPVVVLGLIACGGTSIRSGTDPEGSDPGGNNVGTGAKDPGGIAGNSVSATGGYGGTVTGSFGGSFGGNIAGFGTCFEAGSLVATPNGSVPIERLRIGDQVLAFDEQAGSVAARRVTATFVHEVEESGRLALADGRVLRVTAEHPIYDVRLGDYVRADTFDGDEPLVTLVQTQTPGELSSTGAATALPSLGLATSDERGFVSHETGERVAVFNISVEGLENYFVEGVLVHNKSGTGQGPTCFDAAPMFNAGACISGTSCIHPAAAELDHVELNEPVSGSGEAGAPGAGGYGGTDQGQAGETTGPNPIPAISAPICVDLPQTANRFLAVDYRMPETGDGTPGFAVYGGNGPNRSCSGVQQGEVWLNEYMPPAIGSITTQCVLLRDPALTSVSVESLHPAGEVTNLRFVSSCACARGRKYWTTCGLQDGGTCEQP